MPSTVPALLLTHNSEVKSARVTIQSDELGCQLSDAQKYLKKKTAPQILGTYPWKNQTLHLVGYKEGKAGTENQHELPPPHDKELYFGDILVFLSKDKKSFARPIPMKTDEYENFYTQMFEGFESLSDSDSEDEEDYDEEEEDEGGEQEGEFEENEEQGDFSDDNDDQQSLEEFEGNFKKEEEEDYAPVIVKKKIAPKATAAKGKGKSSKEPSVVQGNLEANVELKPEESISTAPPVHAQRLVVYQIIQKFLGKYLAPKQIIELEHHIYNSSLIVASKKHILKNWSYPLFQEIYSSLARVIIGNLNPTSYIQNKGLFERFQQGKATLEEIANFGFSDLYPEIWKDLSIRQFEREKRQLEGNRSMATDRFECKRCHKSECTYYELQTRSADEPMTIFIQCVNCGKHWRQ
jgi:DNA-directed RNA polymerase subunit M/transcription elongation factor TFIIS